MNFPKREIIERIKSMYKPGARIVLDRMDDPYRTMPKGLQGTVICTDDCGTVHCQWDNGSTLGAVYGEDQCHLVTSEQEIKISLDHIGASGNNHTYCPRCGLEVKQCGRLLAHSRRADIMICDQCGMMEALEDAGLKERMPLSEWKLVENNWRS